MTWTIQLDPPAVAVNRTMVDLSPADNSIMVDTKGIDWGDAAITAYEAAEQRWGSVPVSYRVPNRNVSIPLFLGGDVGSSGEAARARLQSKVALIQRQGGWLLRQRQGGPAMYADVVNATLNVPDIWMERGGVEANVTLTLECLPDFYGDPVALDTINGTGETTAVLQQGGVQATILGDHPGRATLTVLEGSSNQQFGFIWGFRSYYYSASASAALSWPAAATLTPATGATVSALAGARGGQAIAQTGIGAAFKQVGSGTFSHVGTYQVWARVYSATAGVELQWMWGVGDASSPIENTEVSLPGTSAFYLVNLGQVRIDPAPIGNQQWTGQLWAESETTPGAAVSWDMLYLQPLDEAAGFLSGVLPSNPTMLSTGRLQVRYDSAFRSIAGGTVFAPVAQVFGDLPRIPPSGQEGRAVQLLAKPTRSDLSSSADSGGTDAFSVAVSYRPSYMFRP